MLTHLNTTIFPFVKLPRLSQIPNLQNYELIPSGSRIFYMYHTMMTLVTVLVCLHIFLQTELLGRGVRKGSVCLVYLFSAGLWIISFHLQPQLSHKGKVFQLGLQQNASSCKVILVLQGKHSNCMAAFFLLCLKKRCNIRNVDSKSRSAP